MSINCLYLKDRRIWGRFSTGERPIPFLQHKDQSAGGGGGGVSYSGRVLDLTILPSTDKVRKTWSYTYTSPYALMAYPLFYRCVWETVSGIRILKTCLVFVTATESIMCFSCRPSRSYRMFIFIVPVLKRHDKAICSPRYIKDITWGLAKILGLYPAHFLSHAILACNNSIYAHYFLSHIKCKCHCSIFFCKSH
jgi:hypothetical protein